MRHIISVIVFASALSACSKKESAAVSVPAAPAPVAAPAAPAPAAAAMPMAAAPAASAAAASPVLWDPAAPTASAPRDPGRPGGTPGVKR